MFSQKLEAARFDREPKRVISKGKDLFGSPLDVAFADLRNPCPFCGSEEIVWSGTKHGTRQMRGPSPREFLTCRTCGATGPSSQSYQETKGGVSSAWDDQAARFSNG